MNKALIGLKEKIANKHGIIKGFSIYSDTHKIEHKFYNCMQEYAEAYHKHRVNLISDEDIDEYCFKNDEHNLLKSGKKIGIEWLKQKLLEE